MLIRSPRCPMLKLNHLFLRILPNSSSIPPKLPVSAHARKTHTIADQQALSPAATYLNSLSKSHLQSICVSQRDRATSVKAEIAQLLRDKSYEALLTTIVKWTSPILNMPLHQILDQQEMAHILRSLVEYQKRILLKASTLHIFRKSEVTSWNSKMAQARGARNQIRSIYANLLSPPGKESEHLYSKSGRFLVLPLTPINGGVVLVPADYENLISLELNNGKLDLASNWFRRMELQYSDGTVYKHMTQTLWLLRFQLFGNAQLSLWRVERSALNDVIINPRRSRFKSETKWLDLFKDYLQHQLQFLDKSRTISSNELISVMLASIAYDHNTEQSCGLIEVSWGISSKGATVPGFAKPAALAPLFPDLNVLISVVVSMLFNQKYVAAIAYINAFQQLYGIQLNRVASKNFWDQTFRWAEISTQFSEAKVFQFYMNETKLLASADLSIGLGDDFPLLLAEAKKLADFDYEGFLNFVSDLRTQRVGLISELWKCFHKCNPGFSVRPYWAYLRLAEEYLQPLVTMDPWQSEHLCSKVSYDILRELLVQNKKHAFSLDSYNAHMLPDTLWRIREIYLKTMRVLIHAKGCTGRLGEIPHIIAKWGLDTHMIQALSLWARRNEETYLEKEREAKRVREEEEEGLLDLM